MDSQRARQIYLQYASAVAFVDVERPDGTRGIGTAFHVGDRVFVTARHVVEGNRILEVKLTEPIAVPREEFLRDVLHVDEKVIADNEAAHCAAGALSCMFKDFIDTLAIADGPFLASEKGLDVAVFRVEQIHPRVPFIKLGMHWDDWIFRSLWHLSDAVILGYPPIPMVNEPVLVAARAEIHTHVMPRHVRAVHFILSAIPRGGFSGGVAILESGEALGVITSSLLSDGRPEELGFFAVLSIEAIVGCLAEHNLYPESQRKHYESLAGFDPGPMISAVGDMMRGKMPG